MLAFRHPFQLYALFLATLCAIPAFQTASEPVGAGSGGLHCDRRGWQHPRPTLEDCGIAARVLPHDPTEGTFHTGGAKDAFELPLEAIFGTCRVLVELTKDTEVYSWMRVSNAAIRMNIACLTSGPGPWKTGGWTDLGPHDRLNVSLSRAPNSGGVGGGNLTVVNDELGINGTEGGYIQVLERHQV